MDEKLKPCPFCGERARLVIRATKTVSFEGGKVIRDKPLKSYSVCCSGCGMRPLSECRKKDAIAAWNRREARYAD